MLGIRNCNKLKTPPREICEQGMRVVLAYLKRLSQGSTRCYRTKLMFVGLGGAGKTSYVILAVTTYGASKITTVSCLTHIRLT